MTSTEQLTSDLGDIAAESRTLEAFADTPEGKEAAALLQRLCLVNLSILERLAELERRTDFTAGLTAIGEDEAVTAWLGKI